MLIDFKIKNFRSFYDTTEISMVSDNKKKEYTDRLISIKDSGKVKMNILPAMVIYGSNASGKTTLISALDTLKEIVINGTIKKQINNEEINKLEISAFIHDAKKMQEPIEFEITFKSNLNIYNYILKLKVMNPMISQERAIYYEEFNVVKYSDFGTSIKEIKTNLFKRYEEQVILNNSEEVTDIYEKGKEYLDELKNIEKIINENLDKETLFLSNSFKGIVNLKIANDVLEWFQEKLYTIVNFDFKELNVIFENANPDCIMTNELIDRLLKLADFGPQKIGYAKDPQVGKFVLSSVYEPTGINKGLIIRSKDIESKGTTKLINFWIAFMQLFNRGGIFVIDELDCSIHPELIGGIIDLFNNKEINKTHAQLIFNTHNPLYLQNRFFRRDQILFVEKDSELYKSNVYKLSDFNLATDNNYMKKYFEGMFGAIPYIDFASIFDKKEEK